MKKKKIIILIILAIVVLCGVFLAIKVTKNRAYLCDRFGISQPDTEYTLTITKSDFVNEVAKELYDNGIIVSQVRFAGYMNKYHKDFKWINGTYNVTAKMSYRELCKKFENPDTVLEYVSVTVPEGKTLTEIAEIIETGLGIPKSEFMTAADSYDYDYEFIKELKTRDQTKIGYKLEGYLYPAKYEFRKDTVTAREVVSEMLRAFSGYVNGEVISKAKAKDLSVNELITLASVIQGEAPTTGSMKKVSSVFWNRLNTVGIRRLQSDPTTTYAKSLKTLKGYSEKMYNGYDSYVCEGIPSGPINNPGMDAINAVLEPADTDYYYFVTDPNGIFYFSKTYAEHQEACRNIRLSK